MIRKIIQAITRRIDAHTAREDELMQVTRRFNLALTIATKKHDGDPAIMRAIVMIAGQALQASDANDLEYLKDCAAQIQEYSR